MTDFQQGALVAIGLLVRLHDQPGMAADVLISMGLHKSDCSSLDEFDKASLRKLVGERPSIALRNLK